MRVHGRLSTGDGVQLDRPAAGRYAYGNQPAIAQWNLARFAETLLPLLDTDAEKAIALAEESLGAFPRRYEDCWSAGMRAKLGVPDAPADVVAPLVEELLTQMQHSQVDHTSFYRGLSSAARGDAEPVRGEFIDLAAFDDWVARWRALGPDADAMDRVNPVYIPRNHLVEEALTAGTAGDLAPLERLLDGGEVAVRRTCRPAALCRARAEGVQFLVPNFLWNLTARAYRGGHHEQLQPGESLSANSVRLGLQDLLFIYGETSSSMMHVAGLLPFTPPADAPRGYLRADDRRRARARRCSRRGTASCAYPRVQFSPLQAGWSTRTSTSTTTCAAPRWPARATSASWASWSRGCTATSST